MVDLTLLDLSMMVSVPTSSLPTSVGAMLYFSMRFCTPRDQRKRMKGVFNIWVHPYHHCGHADGVDVLEIVTERHVGLPAPAEEPQTTFPSWQVPATGFLCNTLRQIFDLPQADGELPFPDIHVPNKMNASDIHSVLEGGSRARSNTTGDLTFPGLIASQRCVESRPQCHESQQPVQIHTHKIH